MRLSKRTSRSTTKADPYQRITDRIVSMLEEGTAPWRRPWSGADAGEPVNLKSGKSYRGINRLLLGCSGYGSPYWLTYKQAKERGGHVQRGEKGWPCVFWKWLDVDREPDPETGEKRTGRVPLLRIYTVFNVEQTDGCRGVPETATDERSEPERIDAAEALWKGYAGRPELRHGGSRAFYRYGADLIGMPPLAAFETAETYYSTLFHEMTHSTGDAHRLDREGRTFHRFGDPVYSREELVAEMGSAFLCAEAGISAPVIENQAAYLASWIKVLKGKPKLCVIAAAQAQRGADWIMGRRFEAAPNQAVAAPQAA